VGETGLEASTRRAVAGRQRRGGKGRGGEGGEESGGDARAERARERERQTPFICGRSAKDASDMRRCAAREVEDAEGAAALADEESGRRRRVRL